MGCLRSQMLSCTSHEVRPSPTHPPDLTHLPRGPALHFAGFFPPPDRKCFRREGVAPDQQFSRAPGPDESVKCFSGYLEGAEEVPCRCTGRGWVRTACSLGCSPAGLLRRAGRASRCGCCAAARGSRSREPPRSPACSEAAVLETPWEKTVSLPLTKCPDQCNTRG